MNIGGTTLANFRELGNIPVLNDKFVRVDNGTEISLFISFSIFTGMLLGPFALFKLKVFNSFRTSLGVVGDKKNVFALLFVEKESKVFLVFGIFLSNLPAIDVKRLLK